MGCVRNSDRSQVFQAHRAIAFGMRKQLLLHTHQYVQKDYLMHTHQCQLFRMGYVRLKIRELAEERGWTLKDVANRSGVNYNTVRSYVQRGTLNTVDLSAVFKIARAFEVTLEELVEVLEE